MKKEKFKNVLQKDEEIVFVEGVNKKSFIIKKWFGYIALFGFVSFFIAQFATIATGIVSYESHNEPFSIIMVWPTAWIISFIIGIVIGLVFSIIDASNTYFAITNKRIISRYGVFSTNYIHYSLKNIGTISIKASIFDSKGDDASATLIMTVKDFHTNTDGNTRPLYVSVYSLKSAYKAYTILSEKTDGNNESFRIEIEKNDDQK